MHTKEIAKTEGKYMLIEELFPYYKKLRSPARMVSHIFDGSS